MKCRLVAGQTGLKTRPALVSHISSELCGFVSARFCDKTHKEDDESETGQRCSNGNCFHQPQGFCCHFSGRYLWPLLCTMNDLKKKKCLFLDPSHMSSHVFFNCTLTSDGVPSLLEWKQESVGVQPVSLYNVSCPF